MSPGPPSSTEARPAAAAGAEPGEALREILARVGQITRDSQEVLQQLAASERRFRRLAKAVWRVQEEERRRLARELHDGLGQNLTALKNQLETLAREASAGAGPHAGLAAAVELAGRLLQDTRELSRLLRPPILDDLGLVPALRWLARTLRESSGLDVRLDIDMETGAGAAGLDPGAGTEDARRLPPDLETLVFRIAQEALTNVVRHSGAADAGVALRVRAASLVLAVADRGAGFEPAALDPAAQGAGSGLSGIRDRVELFGGRCSIRSAPGAGTRLEIEVPLPGAGGLAAGAGPDAGPGPAGVD
jgi:two-component system NarL family sensor kinase